MGTNTKLVKALRKCIGMARGIIVLDENLYELEDALIEANMRVVTPEPGMSDKTIAKKLAVGRILITKNSKDFLRFAPMYDFGIIALENLKYIDPSKDDSNRTVSLISEIITDANLWSRSTAFIVTVKNDNTYTIKDLV